MYSGDYMARIMSFVTVVFILVPVVAPAMGKFILDSSLQLAWDFLYSVLISIWFLGGFKTTTRDFIY
jgi:DHA1 family bicyclomycin/chloramphenicol resistance-like MFS transporter